MTGIQKILVATDFSPASDAALDMATRLIGRGEGEIVVFHAFEIPLPAYPNLAFMPLVDALPSFEQAARTAVDTAVAGLKQRTTARVRGLVRCGSPWREIVDTAAKERADIVVIGTRGRTGLAHLLLGSVAEKVVRMATVPVLTVHPSGEPTTDTTIPSAR